MPTKPNYPILEAVKSSLPKDASITNSNNTITIIAPDDKAKGAWKRILFDKRLVVIDHSIHPLTLIVSMWPKQQILVTNAAIESDAGRRKINL